MSLSLRELDGRIKQLEQLNIAEVKTEQVRQRGLLEATAEDVSEIKDSIRWVVRLVAGTVLVSIIGAVLALVGLSA